MKITAIFQKASGQPEVTIILRDNRNDLDDIKEGREIGELLYKHLPALTLENMRETISRLVKENE